MARTQTGSGVWSGPPQRAAVAAGVWSLVYGMLGLWWALGGAGFPFGPNDSGGAGWSLLTGLRPEVGGPTIAVLGLAGVAAAAAIRRSVRGPILRPLVLAFAWIAGAALLFVVPDLRVLIFIGYLPALIVEYGFGAVDWPVLNQYLCLAGGVAWIGAAFTYQRCTVAFRSDRGRDEWAAEPAPRWGTWATYAAVVLPLPYAATRLAWAFGIPLGLSDASQAASVAAGGVTAPGFSLGGMALAGALLTVGLARRWGEVVPGWVPAVGGKRVPPVLAIVPATVASTALIVGGLAIWRMAASGSLTVFDSAVDWGAVPPALLFLPWGVALGLATLAYAHRRRAQNTRGGRA